MKPNSGDALIVKLGLKPKDGESEDGDEAAAAAAFLEAAKGDDPAALLDAFHNLMGACGY